MTPNKKPLAGKQGVIDQHAYQNALRKKLYGDPATNTIADDWRNRLPAPEIYYRQHLDGLHAPNPEGWAAVVVRSTLIATPARALTCCQVRSAATHAAPRVT